MTQLLIVHVVALTRSPGLSRVIHINRLFAERSVEILKGRLFRASQKELGIAVTDDDINQEFEDKELDVTATCELKIIIPFDMGFNNSLMDLIEKSDMQPLTFSSV